MANEATLVFEEELPVRFKVADGTGIEKGALLKMADAFTASSADGTNDILAGIASQEKIASNGQVAEGVYQKGIFKLTASGAITVGDPVGAIATWTNYVASQKDTLTLSGLRTLGHALETVTNGQTVLVKVNVQESNFQ